MENWFATHNSHLEGAEHFSARDPNLRNLAEKALVHPFAVLDKLPLEAPGIYTLSGAHLSGKTTLLKNWMKRLIEQNIPTRAIAFCAGESISDYHSLHQLLKRQLLLMPDDRVLYLIIDDVSFIRDFDKAILPLKKSGLLDSVVLLLSSSDATLAQPESEKSFHLSPLSFRETVILKNGDAEPSQQLLYKEFKEYLLHGGNLVAINEYVTDKKIQDKTLTEYGDWICKETTRRGKQERFLREILKSCFKYYNNQITWNALAPELSIDHPKTIGDYFSWLEALDVVFIQHALLEKTLSAAPKKARKIMFTDPFYFHALYAWLNPEKNYFDTQIKTNLEDDELVSRLVKSCAITNFKNYYPTYYIKAEGEVDLAYVDAGKFWPIETTWASQLRAKDLKQILKYANGRILTKTERSGIIQHIQTEPLPAALWQLENRKLSQ